MFKIINDDKNNNFMLYIYELYVIKEFEKIEIKIKDIISKINFAENTSLATSKEYSNTSLLYCCYMSYRIFQKNKSDLSWKNFYKIYTYLLLSELTISFTNDDRNTIILLSIKENLEFEKINNFVYFEIKNKDIRIDNLKNYISIDEFLEINNSLNYWIEKEKVDKLFVTKWNKNFTKWPLKDNFIVINLYYIYLSSENKYINIIKNNLLSLDLTNFFHIVLYINYFW